MSRRHDPHPAERAASPSGAEADEYRSARPRLFARARSPARAADAAAATLMEAGRRRHRHRWRSVPDVCHCLGGAAGALAEIRHHRWLGLISAELP